VNFAAECTSGEEGRESRLRNYTFRSMPRRSASKATAAQPEHARDASSPPPMPDATQTRPRRLNKRVVQKPDGRYLIYYEKA
jgi:hypothetical protein